MTYLKKTLGRWFLGIIVLFVLLAEPLTAAGAAMLSAQERAAIERACERLVIDYAYYVDHQDTEGYINLFTEDADLIFRGPPIKGRAALAEQNKQQAKILGRRHISTNVRITALDANNAEGTVYVTVYGGPGGEGAPASADKTALLDGPSLIGEYRDRYVRTKDGWRFASRRLVIVMANAKLMKMMEEQAAR
jgi:ketosteroid isomerase-like protein